MDLGCPYLNYFTILKNWVYQFIVMRVWSRAVGQLHKHTLTTVNWSNLWEYLNLHYDSRIYTGTRSSSFLCLQVLVYQCQKPHILLIFDKYKFWKSYPVCQCQKLHQWFAIYMFLIYYLVIMLDHMHYKKHQVCMVMWYGFFSPGGMAFEINLQLVKQEILY